MSHHGFAFIDVVSPCVTFNNHVGSTKSYEFVRDHIQATGKVDFIPLREEITTQYEPGTMQEVALHDGSMIALRKAATDFDATNRGQSLKKIREADELNEILTGLLFIDANAEDTHDIMNTADKPLNTLSRKELCPGNDALKKINASLR
jgi:2-oxoglutarate ferredoxin oxidoreductase subunit beta